MGHTRGGQMREESKPVAVDLGPMVELRGVHKSFGDRE